MEFHDIAQVFPMLPQAELETLAADIKANGLHHAITTLDGKVLDGRNRYVACELAGVAPRFEEYTGGDPVAFVISENIARRHLDETQRGIVANKIANMPLGGATYRSANLPTDSISQSAAAEMLNVSERTIRNVKAVEKAAPDLMQKMEQGEMTVHAALKEVRARELATEREKVADAGKLVEQSKRWHVYHGCIETWEAPRQYDFVITDPPYPKEFLPLYETLAIRSNEWLKDGGLLIAMCGQSYLDQIYAMMSKHLTYYWTAAYLTPGQPTPIRQVNVNTTWKPLLIMSKGKYTGKIFGDVFTSDGNDKSFHKWGQSESGMYSIVSGICLPGQTILDPFCGAGTTLIAALKHGCLPDGLEKEIENVNIARGRLA